MIWICTAWKPVQTVQHADLCHITVHASSQYAGSFCIWYRMCTMGHCIKQPTTLIWNVHCFRIVCVAVWEKKSKVWFIYWAADCKLFCSIHKCENEGFLWVQQFLLTVQANRSKLHISFVSVCPYCGTTLRTYPQRVQCTFCPVHAGRGLRSLPFPLLHFQGRKID